MSVEENKAIAKRWNDEIMNRGNVDVIDELAAANYINYASNADREAHKQWATELRAANSDLGITIEDTIAEGDKVVVRWTMHGTHTGEYQGIPPTGKEFTMSGISIYRIQDCKIVEDWSNSDMLGAMRQLGLLPPEGGGEG